MKDLLILTCADGLYLDYTPLWEYCIRKSIPEAKCECIEITQKPCNYFSACYRLLFTPEPGYKYYYIDDVDIMHTKESPSLMEYHLDQMKNTGLCYSNTLRKWEYLGDQRMTGLNFVTPEWYEKTADLREKYLHMLSNGEIGQSRFDDEMILKKVCVESELEIPPRQELVPRHKGIHLGTLRAYRNHSRGKRNQQLRIRISPEQAARYLKYYEDPEYQKIVQKVCKSSKVIKWELETLYSFCRREINHG